MKKMPDALQASFPKTGKIWEILKTEGEGKENKKRSEKRW